MKVIVTTQGVVCGGSFQRKLTTGVNLDTIARVSTELFVLLQRLFNEGDFTATYKYALLIALADIAVESGGDDGTALRITHKALGTKFVELYWQQAAPYAAGVNG